MKAAATMEMTEKQRRAVQALEGARSEGVTLNDYAKTHDLPLRELYDAIAALRRKGVLSKPVSKRASSRFVAVRVAQRVPPTMSSTSSVPLCRIVQRGCVIECLQWPPPSWLAELTPGSSDGGREFAHLVGPIGRVTKHSATFHGRPKIEVGSAGRCPFRRPCRLRFWCVGGEGVALG